MNPPAAKPRPPARFATARLDARPPRAEDADAVFAGWAADPEVTRYLAWPAYTQTAPLAAFLRESAAQWERGGLAGHYPWLLCLKGTDTPIGSVGVTFEGQGRAMFGYVLGKRWWGRGFAAEALAPLVDWALAQPGIFRAWAFCDTANPASVRVMEKVGLQREGVLRRWHVCPTLGPEPRDCLVCAKVR